jgi:hypothetical protein
LTGQPGQNRDDKPGHDSSAKRASDKIAAAPQLAEGWDRTAGRGQPGQDSWDRTAARGQLGQDSLDRTAIEDSQDSTLHPG